MLSHFPERDLSGICRCIAIDQQIDFWMYQYILKTIHQDPVGIDLDPLYPVVLDQPLHERRESRMREGLPANQADERLFAIAQDESSGFFEGFFRDLILAAANKFIGKAVGAAQIAAVCQHDVRHSILFSLSAAVVEITCFLWEIQL